MTEQITSSAELEKLFQALALAQGEMKPAVLDMKNPHFNSRYASMTSIQEAYQGPLHRHGLSIVQQVFSDDSRFFIRTVLGHTSGQWMASVFELVTDRKNMQSLGSAITYARRYGISALIGVVDTEDDDGNAAVGKPDTSRNQMTRREPNRPVIPEAISTHPSQPLAQKPEPAEEAASILSSDQLARLFAIAAEQMWTKNDLRHYMFGKYHTDSTKKLTLQQYDELCRTMQSMSAGEALATLLLEADSRRVSN
jgi:hypothetical protein